MNVELSCQLRLPDSENLFSNILDNADHAYRMIRIGSRAGKSVVICGAGPSLRDHCDNLPEADEVWACNSALPFLFDRGVRVTHGFTIDQNDAMCADQEFGRALPVTYYLASSVHPSVTERLMLHGRQIEWFHSYLGVPSPEGWADSEKSYEMWLYTNKELFGDSVQVGHGLNSALRAICLALAMGFEKVTVVGADCAARPDAPAMPHRTGTPEYIAWLESLELYADGRSGIGYGAEESFAEATFDGKRWHTRPDMIISAVQLLELVGHSGGRVTIVGNTLPRAILEDSLRAENPEEFWGAFPTISRDGNVTNWANKLEFQLEAA